MPEPERNLNLNTILRMGKILKALILSCSLINCFSQDCDTTVYKYVDEQPEYLEGMMNLHTHLMGISLPEMNDAERMVSKFYFSIVIDCEGHVAKVRAIKNTDHPVSRILEEEIKISGPWAPGKKNHQRVNTQIILPVNIHWE